jgi:hypothetical protein
MGWIDLMIELETKVNGALQGTYHPLDNLPLFRVQYPPAEEKQAFSQFVQLKNRFEANGRFVKLISLTDIFRESLSRLIGCEIENLAKELIELETARSRIELQSQLSEYLPDEIGAILGRELAGMSRDNLAVILRMGALYPFIRSSSLVSHLEGHMACPVILPYPGITLGALLDAPPADPHGGYYRGENIPWR